jgi:predicted nucleic acid-binding protein
MIIVSNTSPLNYLVLIESVEILPRLFGSVYAPEAVIRELKQPGSPEVVRVWAATLPEWLLVREPTQQESSRGLDAGESAAIALSHELSADALLIDDRDGRQAARDSGLRIIGTLGVLNGAAGLGLVDLPLAILRLKNTNFRMTESIVQELLREDRERKRNRGDDHDQRSVEATN